MQSFLRRYLLPIILVATLFGVFVLPFLFPPPYLQGVSLSNIVGFNNKVAYVVTAALGLAVFLIALRWPVFNLQQQPDEDDKRPLSLRLRLITASTVGALIAIFAVFIVSSGFRYKNDAYYFIYQISMHTDYGRVLYDQIEFPYGPLLFYAPVAVRALLSPFHVSAVGAFFTTLVLFQASGMLLLGWMLNRLPILHRWRVIFYFVLAVHAIQPCFGLNYTFIRFSASAVMLTFAALQRRPWSLAAALFVGQFISLGLSPEMGFAFFASGMALAIWHVYFRGTHYLLAVAAPLFAAPAFIVTVGTGYVRMLGLFAKGVFSYPVEPLPHVLLFLFAFIWLVPPVLALSLRRNLPHAPMIAALYVFSTALLPVAFGRSDPGHVILNEIPLFMLSLVAIGWYTPVQQRAWASVLTVILLWGALINLIVFKTEYRSVIRYYVFHSSSKVALNAFKRIAPGSYQHAVETEARVYRESEGFTLPWLRSIVGNDPVAVPGLIPLPVEQTLRDADQFTPGFYCYGTAVLDRTAELHQIEELNRSRWMLTQHNPFEVVSDDNEGSAVAQGLYLPYPKRYPPYKVGEIFARNLKQNWEPRGSIGDYIVYRRRDSPAAIP